MNNHRGIWIDLAGGNAKGTILYAIRQCALDLKAQRRPALAFALLYVYRELRREHSEKGFGPLYFTAADRLAYARDFVGMHDEMSLIRAAETRRRIEQGGWFRMLDDWDRIHRQIRRLFKNRYPELDGWLVRHADKIQEAEFAVWVPPDNPLPAKKRRVREEHERRLKDNR